jgi:hypothetical protein
VFLSFFLSFFLWYSASEAREAFDVDELVVKEKCLPAIWRVSFDEYSNKGGGGGD